MAHPLQSYFQAREERHRTLVTLERDGIKTFFAGATGFTAEREAASRFQVRPNQILERFPGAKFELA